MRRGRGSIAQPASNQILGYGAGKRVPACEQLDQPWPSAGQRPAGLAGPRFGSFRGRESRCARGWAIRCPGNGSPPLDRISSTGFHATSPPSPIRPPAAANSCARNLASLDRLKESCRRPCTDYRHGSKPEGEHQAAAAEHIPIKPRGQVGIGLYLNAWSDDPEHLPACGQSGRLATRSFLDLENARAGRDRIGRTSGCTVLLELTTMSRIAPCPTLKLPRIPRPGRPWKRSGPVAAGSPT